MKTTLELPDALVKQVKLRALLNGMKLKDAVAELLRKGLASSETPKPRGRSKRARIVTDPITGLPMVVCNKKPRMTAEELNELVHLTQTQEDLERLGLSL